MDIGYPALIIEPLKTPSDPKNPTSYASVNPGETQTDFTNPDSSGTQETKTPMTSALAF